MSDLDDFDDFSLAPSRQTPWRRTMTAARRVAIKKGMAGLSAGRVKAASSLRVREAHSRAHRKHVPISLAPIGRT